MQSKQIHGGKKVDEQLPGAGGRGEWGVNAKGRLFSGGDANVRKSDGGHGHTTL